MASKTTKIQVLHSNFPIVPSLDKLDEGNKIVRLSVKMDDNVANRATINDKGLFVSNITDCGAF